MSEEIFTTRLGSGDITVSLYGGGQSISDKNEIISRARAVIVRTKARMKQEKQRQNPNQRVIENCKRIIRDNQELIAREELSKKILNESLEKFKTHTK